MGELTRRDFISFTATAAAMTWAAPVLGRIPDSVLMADAESIYRAAVVIDMVGMEPVDEPGKKNIKNSGVTCMSPTVGVRRPSNPAGTHMMKAFPFRAALEDCADWSNSCAANPELLLFCRKTADILAAKSTGRTGVLLNFQNATHIEDNLDNLNLFFDLGVRSIQLTYNERNLLGDGSTERTDAGLSDFGVSVVERMNELGICVDSGHCGHQTTIDAIKLSKKTPIISHSNCYALNAHPRNKTDEQIKLLANRGGVMGLTTVGTFVKQDMPAKLSDFLDHVDHIVKLVGIDHVACGSDQAMRGWRTDPEGEKEFQVNYGPQLFKSSYRFRYPIATEGLNEPRKWLNATAGMLKRGYSAADIQKFLGGNWLRVFKENFG